MLSVYLSTAMMLWDLGYRGDCMGGCMRSDPCHRRRGGGGGVERQDTATPTPPLFSADSTQAAKSNCALLLFTAYCICLVSPELTDI